MDATLQLMLYRASQLPSTERTSKIDAYVKVVAGTQTIKSATMQDNDNPVVRAVALLVSSAQQHGHALKRAFI